LPVEIDILLRASRGGVKRVIAKRGLTGEPHEDLLPPKHD